MEATILIVTDHTGGPAGTEELARSRRFRLAGRVPSLARAVEHAQGGQVDVLVVEVSTPERLREVATGLGLPPGTKVIVLSGLAAETTLLPVMAAGVQGFVRRPVPDGLLSAAVGAVLNGGAFVDPRSTKWLVSVALRGHRRDPEDGLTLRQSQVVALVRGGLTNREIGRVLGVSLPTVKSHLYAAMRRLGASDRWTATALADRLPEHG